MATKKAVPKNTAQFYVIGQDDDAGENMFSTQEEAIQYASEMGEDYGVGAKFIIVTAVAKVVVKHTCVLEKI